MSTFLLCGCSEDVSSSSSTTSQSSSTSETSSNSESSSSSTSSSTTDSKDDDSGDTPTPVIPSSITNVTINGTISDFYVGDYSENISASISGTGDYNKYVTWSVDKEGIIEFEAKQNRQYIRALSAGEVVLTATSNQDDSKSASITITVLEPVVESVSLNVGSNITLEKYASKSISATVNGKGSYSKDVTWESSNKDIVEISGTSNNVTVEALKCGTTTLTATAGNGKTASTTINVTPNFNYDSKMTYKLVTSVDDLTLGERYIIVSSSNNVAMTPTLSKDHLLTESITKDGDLIKGVKGSEVMTFVLEGGTTVNSYSFNYKDKYVSSREEKKMTMSSSIDGNSSWTIDVSSDKTTIKSVNNDFYLKENGFFATYGLSSGVRDVCLYKYESGKENIEFSFGDTLTLSTNSTKEYSIFVNGFEPTSYSFDVDSSIASISEENGKMKITTTNVDGETSVECTASDGSISVSKSFSLRTTTYSYTFDEGKYAFTSALSINAHYLSSSSSNSDANPFVIDNDDCYLSFTKALEGNDTFFIKNSDGKYLNKSDGQARVTFTDTEAIWILSKVDNQIYASIEANGTYYLTYKEASNPWICVSNKAAVNLVSLPTSVKDIVVDSSSLKKTTYNFDETFDSTGLKVNVTFETSLGDITLDMNSLVTWNESFDSSSIGGNITLLSLDHSVVVNGLTITHYVLDSITLDASKVIKDYVDGDAPRTDDLVVTAHYLDGGNERTETVTDYTVSPETINESTTEITITYNDKSATYPINEVLPNRFKPTDHLTTGYHITFGATLDNIGYEIAPATNSVFTSHSEYVDNPRGSLVFTVVKSGDDYRVVEGTNVYLHWRLQVCEVLDDQYTSLIGKYLTVDGSKKALLTLTDDNTSDSSIFWYKASSSKEDDTEALTLYSKLTSNIISINKDSNDFTAHAFNSSYSEITVYRDKNVNP